MSCPENGQNSYNYKKNGRKIDVEASKEEKKVNEKIWTLNITRAPDIRNPVQLKLTYPESYPFADLFDQHMQKVYQVAYRMTLSHCDVEDVVQEVFVKLHKKLHQFEAKSEITTWIYKITVNTSVDLIRKSKKHKTNKIRLDINSIEKDTHNYVDNDYQQKEISKKMAVALKQIHQRYRVVIVLRDFEEMTYTEMAKILNTNIGTISSRLNRAYKKLRKELEKLGIDKNYIEN